MAAVRSLLFERLRRGRCDRRAEEAAASTKRSGLDLVEDANQFHEAINSPTSAGKSSTRHWQLQLFSRFLAMSPPLAMAVQGHRKARFGHVDLLLRLRNDPDVRLRFFPTLRVTLFRFFI